MSDAAHSACDATGSLHATFDQRYDVAMQRLDDPGSLPNEVVATVIVLEAVARAFVVDLEVARGLSREKAYSKHWRQEPVALINAIRAQVSVSSDWFHPDDLQVLPHAVGFRNLLAHEATFLNGGMCKQLIEVTRRLIERIHALAISERRQ